MATVKLKGIPGYHDGTPIKEVRPGDIIFWSSCLTSRVLSIEPVGKASYRITAESDGKTFTRTVRGERPVVIQADISLSVSKAVEAFLFSHKANMRPLTLEERMEANRHDKRQANFLLTTKDGKQHYTKGTLKDLREIIKRK